MAGQLCSLLLFLNCVSHVLSALPYEVNRQKLSGCDTEMSIDNDAITVARGVQGAPCTGLLEYQLNGKRRPLCGYQEYFNKAAAQRLCFTLGLDMDREPGRDDGVRLYRCDIYVEDDAPLPDEDSNIVNEVYLSSYLEDKRCNVGTDLTSFTCFDECYFGKSPGATSLPYSTAEDNCNESKNPFYAITCTDVNECLNGVLVDCSGPFDGSCTLRRPCGSNTNCTNMVGSYECACLSGYKPANGDSKDAYSLEVGCTDVDECAESELTCGPTGQCENTAGSYICLCPQGHYWDDTERICEDVDECNPSQCSSQAICTNLPSSFYCECKDGYIGNGLNCEENDPCDMMESLGLCINGECSIVDEKPHCKCESMYEGIACDTPVVNRAVIVGIVVAVVLSFVIAILLFYVCSKVLMKANPNAQSKPGIEDIYRRDMSRMFPYRRPLY